MLQIRGVQPHAVGIMPPRLEQHPACRHVARVRRGIAVRLPVPRKTPDLENQLTAFQHLARATHPAARVMLDHDGADAGEELGAAGQVTREGAVAVVHAPVEDQRTSRRRRVSAAGPVAYDRGIQPVALADANRALAALANVHLCRAAGAWTKRLEQMR